jgi:hypothetical protein
MKRIIKGKTYDTDTATPVARSAYEADDKSWVTETLFMTKGGAFFSVTQDGSVPDRPEFALLTREQAEQWVNNNGQPVELLSDIFGEPEEATADDGPTPELVAVYVRMPETLKRRVERGAKHENMSVNAWMVQMADAAAPKSTRVRIENLPQS